MGWSLKSKMPDYYLKRKTKEQSNQTSLDMQARMMSDAGEANERIQEDELLRRFLSGDNP